MGNLTIIITNNEMGNAATFSSKCCYELLLSKLYMQMKFDNLTNRFISFKTNKVLSTVSWLSLSFRFVYG